MLIISILISMAMRIVVATVEIDLNRAFQDIFISSEAHDVLFVIQDLRGNENAIINELYQTVSRSLPSTCISFNDTLPENLSSFRLYPRTLISYVYVSKDPPNSAQTDDIISVIVHDDSRPKVLLIPILEERDNNFQSLLKTMWSWSILDVTVMDLSVYREKIIATTVHRYNPFTDDYTKEPYSTQFQWFPDKIKNLYGYPVKVGFYTRRDPRMLQMIRDVLNCTAVPLVETNNTERLFDKVVTGEIEVLMRMIPYTSTGFQISTRRTFPKQYEICALIPLTYKPRKFEFHDIKHILAGVTIIVTFWWMSVFLRFESTLWKPINILGSMLSVSMPGVLNRSAERVAFLGIVLASCFYTSQLCTDLTLMNAQLKVENEYETFEELDESGLIPVIQPKSFNAMFEFAEGTLLRLKEKAITMKDIDQCGDYLVLHKNVSCFVHTGVAETVIHSHMHHGISEAKICPKLCFWRPLMGSIYRKHLPYSDRLDKMLIRISSSGIYNKLYRNHYTDYVSKKMSYPDSTQILLASQIRNIALCGYLISFIVFLGELVIRP